MIILLKRIEPRKKRTIDDIRERRRTFVFMISQAKFLVLKKEEEEEEQDMSTAAIDDLFKLKKQM